MGNHAVIRMLAGEMASIILSGLKWQWKFFCLLLLRGRWGHQHLVHRRGLWQDLCLHHVAPGHLHGLPGDSGHAANSAHPICLSWDHAHSAQGSTKGNAIKEYMDFCRCMPSSGTPESYGGFIFSFLRNFHTIFHSDWTNLHSHQKCKTVPFAPHPFQRLLFVSYIGASLLAQG